MSAKESNQSWDFSPVYDLLQQFSISADPAERRRDFPVVEGEASGESSSSFDQPETPDGETPETGLGNFDKIWEYLSLPPQEASSTVEDDLHKSSSTPSNGTREPKIVKWRDEVDGADLADNDDTGELFDMSHMSKKQRLKVTRKLRKAANGKKHGDSKAAAAPTSSENESEKENKIRRTPDTKRVIHNLLYGSDPSPPKAFNTLHTQVFNTHELEINSEGSLVPKPTILKRYVLPSPEPAPTALAVAAARKEILMRMLNERFPEERQFLDSISLFAHAHETPGPTPEGLHVFIDASNILIGFHDAIKASRSIDKNARIRRQPLSFHSLSLLLTRGRPTSKLVLVGSDNFPAIAEAKSLGYETNILDRVHKAKELTDRQKYFSSHGHKRSPGSRAELSAGSGSETGTAGGVTHADKKWVEQAVDEILHLKMMESIVDCSEPGTMILASGDAAEAEYSGGFLKMVERALVNGWKVEVACFRVNTSGAYRRKEFREKWAKKFKLVELDDFVEVLQGVE